MPVFVTDFLIALLIAVLLTAVFAGGFRRIGPWAGFLWFFVLVFLAAWAGGVWIAPIGPTLWGVHWTPFLMVGLIIALLLAASAPPRRPRSAQEAREQEEMEATASAAASVALSVFFWIVLLLLAVVLVLHYTAERAV